MAGKPKRPVFTENFSSNLTAIEGFLSRARRQQYQELLDLLLEETVPRLCRFPRSGRSFLGRRVGSTDAAELAARLKGRLRKNDELRELVIDDYVILYLVRGARIVFLAIKHHRQLSFDLRRFWTETDQ